MATYRILVGVDYEGKRAEPGDVVNDLPSKSIAWLTAQGIIEPADNVTAPKSTTSKQREPKSPSKGDE